MAKIARLAFRIGKESAEANETIMSFDLSKRTQQFIYSFISKGEICDPPMVRALTEFLEPGDTFIDIGSHIGYYSLFALQKVGRTGRVFAFEANPDTYSVLLSNALANDPSRFIAFNCALSDQEGSVRFSIDQFDEGKSSISYSDRTTPVNSEISVFATTLDEIHSRLGFSRLRSMKIDVEGFEEKVIKGGERLFQTSPPENLVFEVNNLLTGKNTNPDMPIRHLLHAMGYQCYLIRPWLSDYPDYNFGENNYFHLPLDKPLQIDYGNILASRRKINASR